MSIRGTVQGAEWSAVKVVIPEVLGAQCRKPMLSESQAEGRSFRAVRGSARWDSRWVVDKNGFLSLSKM